ncbi:hypothetical protein V5O48_019021 [Marasmius crinis-equi]|uniref:Uncharacterized protein n=1 Tax=Marasmius crinis-equi TaxID=585013 RepID=A0ABR3EJK2_9AGAR
MPPRVSTEYVRLADWFKAASKEISSLNNLVALAAGNGGVIQHIIQQYADTLVGSKLSAVQTAKDDAAFKLYRDTYEKGSQLIKETAGVTEPKTWFKIKAFLEEMEAFIHKTSAKRKKPLTPALVPDGVDDDDEPEVISHTVCYPQDFIDIVGLRVFADNQVGAGLGASVHAPITVKVEDKPYKNLRFGKSRADMPAESSKRVKLDKPASDITPETKEERSIREAAHEQVMRQINILPFINFTKLSVEDLTSIANFLRHEVTNLQHGLLYQAGIYKNTYNQLTEVNRVRLEKLQLVGPLPMNIDDSNLPPLSAEDLEAAPNEVD